MSSWIDDICYPFVTEVTSHVCDAGGQEACAVDCFEIITGHNNGPALYYL